MENADIIASVISRFSPSDLKVIRTISGLSQAQMAEYLSIDQSTLSYYETGKLKIPHNLSSRLNPVLIQADQNVYLYQQIRESIESIEVNLKGGMIQQ
jgi:DNA-binding transcriptional regulator YiaG